MKFTNSEIKILWHALDILDMDYKNCRLKIKGIKMLRQKLIEIYQLKSRKPIQPKKRSRK